MKRGERWEGPEGDELEASELEEELLEDGEPLDEGRTARGQAGRAKGPQARPRIPGSQQGNKPKAGAAESGKKGGRPIPGQTPSRGGAASEPKAGRSQRPAESDEEYGDDFYGGREERSERRAAQERAATERRKKQVAGMGALRSKMIDIWDVLLEMKPWQRWTVIVLSILGLLGAVFGLAMLLTPKALPRGLAFVQSPYFARTVEVHSVNDAIAGTDLAVRACGIPLDPPPTLRLVPLDDKGKPIVNQFAPKGGITIPMTETWKRTDVQPNWECASMRFITPGKSGEISKSDIPGRLSILARIRGSAGKQGQGVAVGWMVSSPVAGSAKLDPVTKLHIVGAGIVNIPGYFPVKSVPEVPVAASGKVGDQPVIRLKRYWTIEANKSAAIADISGAIETYFIPDSGAKTTKFELSANGREMWGVHPNYCSEVSGKLIDLGKTPTPEHRGGVRLLHMVTIRFPPTGEYCFGTSSGPEDATKDEVKGPQDPTDN